LKFLKIYSNEQKNKKKKFSSQFSISEFNLMSLSSIFSD